MAKKATPTKATATTTPQRTPHAPFEGWPVFDRWAPRLAIGCVVLALLLRLPNLSALSLWVDEFVHVLRARDVANGTGPLFTTDNNGILLTMLQVPLAKLFGATAWWMRLPSVLFGVGMIWLLYRLGEQLFNRYVGILAAWLGVWSLYLVFWSRMSRNYAIFGFFFLLTGWLFLKATESNPESSQNTGFWAKYGPAARPWWWLPIALLAALMSHQLAFFVGVSAGVYAMIVTIGSIKNQTPGWKRQPLTWIAAATAPLFLLALPGINDVLRGPLSALLSAQQLDWILPQSSRLSTLWAEQPWTAWGVYTGTLGYDMAVLYWPAWLGLVAAWWVRPRSAAWLTASTLVPMLLLSFVFREPSLPRYFIFVHPYFLICVAVLFYTILRYLIERTQLVRAGMGGWVWLAIPALLILANVRWKELTNLLLARQLDGHVVDQNLAQYNFTNWRQPCAFVQQNRQPNDLVLSTVTTAAGYYLNTPNVLLFRQMQFDTRTKQFRSNDPQPNQSSAATYEDLRRTVAATPRGWLLADYYFDNVFVSPESRQFVYENMHFYPEASPDGSVMVFGWDHSKPAPQHQNMVVQLGKAQDKYEALPYDINIPTERLQASPKIPIQVRYSGVDTPREALIVFNDNNALYLPANRSKGIETQRLEVNSAWLRPGANKIQIMYEPEVKSDPDKGFTFYQLLY
jgi:uncharacterized membrane protein